MKKITLFAAFACLPLLRLFAQSTCNNMDFGDTTFTNWSGGTGMNTGGFYTPITWTPGLVSNGIDAMINDPNARMTLITQNYIDTNCIDPVTMLPDTLMTSLAPGGGTVSVRLGNSINGAQAEMLSYQLLVTPANSAFQYSFATVMEDPGHPADQQPFFMVNMYDQSSHIIPAGTDTIYSADPAFPYIPSGGPLSLQYRRWIPVAVDLSSYVGQVVTINFINSDCGYAGHFGYTYIDVSCMGSLIANVWPGDCDYDLQACNVDVLTLGIAFGSTGTPRSGASNNWIAQPSTDWAQAIPLGPNYKHSDCDGDGVVGFSDINAILLNYAQTHPYRAVSTSPAVQALPQITLVPVASTVAPGANIDLDVYIASAAQPVNNLYGVAFSLMYDNTLVDNATPATSDFTSSWLGVNNSTMATVTHDSWSSGQTDIGASRVTHTELNGNGYLGRITLKAANVTGQHQLDLNVNDIHAVNAVGTTIPLTGSGATVMIDDASGVQQVTNTMHVNLYPNPATSEVLVNTGTVAKTISITNGLGQIVYSAAPVSEETKISLCGFAPGMYFIHVVSENGSSTQQLIVTE